MKPADEILYACPLCHRSGFTKRGLLAHRCEAKADRAGLSGHEYAKAIVTQSKAFTSSARHSDSNAGSLSLSLPMPKTALSASEPPLEIEPAAAVSTVVVVDPPADPWAKARRYVEAATLFQRASLAAQIMAGLELDALHKKLGMRSGKRTDKQPLNLPHCAGGWGEAVKNELGISADTAARWMEMARAARARLKKGDIDLGAILEKNPGALTPAEQELLKLAVHKISDGQTQLEFLLACGVTKASQASGAKGGHHPKKNGESDDAEAGENDGWEPRAKELNSLLAEALGPDDRWWNECTKARRRELHGNLLDAARAVAETLQPKAGNSKP